ncbi:HK97 gp10 family phage protein [Mycoplana rhizolycopersici]|uniref:HK97 gp10 family phage protein n=1 Tax=Mycoplana rhizolycopersici TaxID=2746702 RepID=A0ABX2QHX0_9HYPH|nr:HK97 gp10 family phage protein [Rhizobium rhizolycopersici]NVP55966.1 HK97 gp10 family phage protein [Rhizobium rhizolycopersici]
MAKSTVKVEGLRELDRALGALPKSTAKAVLRQVLKDAGEPIARAARLGAPRHDMHLYESIDVSTRLNGRQRGLHREENKPTFQEMFVGTNNPAGVFQEFGTGPGHIAQPFMRPAWDAHKMSTITLISDGLWVSIEKAAKRLAKKGGA